MHERREKKIFYGPEEALEQRDETWVSEHAVRRAFHQK